MNPEIPHPSSEELFAYRDGEMTAERRVLIEAHVAGCKVCRDTIDQVSELEADLRSGPDDVGGRYYERLTDAVLKRVASEDRAPRFERRKPEREAPVEEEKRTAPRMPWAAVISTASAAAAVLIVVGVLVRQGGVWRSAPRPSLLEKSAPDAGSLARDSVSAPPSGELAPAGRRDKTSTEPQVAQLKQEPAKEEGAKKMSGIGGLAARAPEQAGQAAPMAKDEAERQLASAGSPTPPTAPPAAMKAGSSVIAAVSPPAGGSGEYGAILRRYGLPPVWEQGAVSNDALLRAEPELRLIYRTGAVGADSARTRLYLAEAVRLRAGAHPDSAAYQEIIHHYRRAIGLAGTDSAVSSVAARRLTEFLEEVVPAPSP
jgi:Putative zinc-finger